MIDRLNARRLTNFLRRHPRAVYSLSFAFGWFTLELWGVVRRFLAKSTLHSILLQGNHVPAVVAIHLLSAVQGNPSVKKLGVFNTNSVLGQEGSRLIADLLQNNSTLTRLIAGGTLGVQGARALQPAIRGNRTLLTTVVSS
jgi:hypothetical protein